MGLFIIAEFQEMPVDTGVSFDFKICLKIEFRHDLQPLITQYFHKIFAFREKLYFKY